MYILTKQYTNKISSAWNVHWQRGLATSSHNLGSAIPLLQLHVKGGPLDLGTKSLQIY